MFNILVVDDEKNARVYMEAVLKKNNYRVFTASDGEEALDALDREHIDLVLLDIMMPNMDGYEFTQTVRAVDGTLPILMISAKQLPDDRHKGFLAGTDDYMTKPVDEEEMLLRIKALLRRAQIVSERKITVGDAVLDYDSMTVSRKEESIALPQKEFQLLYMMLSYPGKIFTRIQLMDEIWGMDSQSADTTVNVHINRLRKRFEDFDEFEIVAIRGIGYKAVKTCE